MYALYSITPPDIRCTHSISELWIRWLRVQIPSGTPAYVGDSERNLSFSLYMGGKRYPLSRLLRLRRYNFAVFAAFQNMDSGHGSHLLPLNQKSLPPKKRVDVSVLVADKVQAHDFYTLLPIARPIALAIDNRDQLFS